ncbi:MAG: 30S ribosomal protein S6--L-glutamate ligase [Rickettsiales bacterium]|nr:30S ribosomal protein S6--L-glutamate ligase [Rickettsiales bacterium]
MENEKIIIGKEEWCSLPDIGLPAIKARVDSGAKTSALHAFNIRTYTARGGEWVKFDIHPIQKNNSLSIPCKAKLVEQRAVKSSSGHMETRPVIETTLKMGGQKFTIQLTLTNRDSMGYRMLLGREAMQGRMMVDPDISFSQRKLTNAEATGLYKASEPAPDGLRIAVLASNKELYSNRRLMEAGKQRGHDMRFINIQHCYMNVSSEEPEIHYRGGETLEHFDAVIPRIKPSLTFYGNAVLRQFEVMGAYCLNSSVSIARSRDKLRSLQTLITKGIPMPTTGFAHSPVDTKELIKMVGGAPLVVKLLEGTQGMGVVLAETAKAAESVINAFKSVKADILVQEFIKEAEGRDLRLFVIDDKVVGSIERVAAKGEFRANLHRGGSANTIKISPYERKIAVQAAKTMGLKVAGVDLIRSGTGPKVLEINSSPGLEGIESITGKDIAALMIDTIEREVKRKRRSKKVAQVA